MRVFTTVPQEDLRRVGAAARGAEAEGYDGIVAPENQHDPFLALAVACLPFTLLEASCRAGSTVMVEARKKSEGR